MMKQKLYQMDFLKEKRIGNKISLLLLAFFLLFITNLAQATVMSTLVAPAYNTQTTWASNTSFDSASVEIYVDPTTTNWIAWNNAPEVNLEVASRPGEVFFGPGLYGMDDYIWLTVFDPNNNSLRLRIDYNDVWGNSSGTQNVIYGDAATTPDVYRKAPFFGQAVTFFDESGSHNSLFSIAGNYKFDFEFYNNTGPANHPNIYLLKDVTTNSIPEPSTVFLFAIGLLAVRKKFIR